LSSSFKERYSLITWREIAGMRDVLIHSYFSIDLNLVWDVLINDLPKLKEEIAKIIKNENAF